MKITEFYVDRNIVEVLEATTDINDWQIFGVVLKLDLTKDEQLPKRRILT